MYMFNCRLILYMPCHGYSYVIAYVVKSLLLLCDSLCGEVTVTPM